MSIYFSTNVPELKSMYTFKTAENQIAKSSYRLATGQRVNTGADDATGFKVRENLRADIKKVEAQSANITKGENTLNIAQDSITQALNVLRGNPDDSTDVGMAGLLAGVDNATPDTEEISAYADMASLFKSALGSAQYNGKSLFQTGGTTFDLVVGQDAAAAPTSQKITIDTKENAGITANYDYIVGALSAGDYGTMVAAVDQAIDDLSAESARLGYKQNAVANVKNAFLARTTMLKEADGRISSVDTAVEGSNLARAELLAQNSMNVMQYSRSFASFVATSAFG